MRTKKKRTKEYLPIGAKFGSWTIVGHIPNKTKIYIGQCECGKTGTVYKRDLLLGKTTSCGCKKEKKRVNTNLRKYGAKHPSQNQDVRDKCKKTCLDRYGAEYTTQTKDMKNKSKATFQKKYGVDNPFQSEKIKDKIKQTNNKRYGVENPSQRKEVQEKRKKTIRDKYGSDNYFSSQEWQYCLNNNKSDLFTSKGEKELRDYIETLGIKTTKMRSGRNEIDIFLEGLGMGIEYNGEYWHSEAHKPSNYHLEKSSWCNKQKIQLIQIFEHEWRLREPQVKNRLMSIFGKNKIKIGARQCTIEEVDGKTASQFVDKYHIQKSAASAVSLALSFNGEVVALAVFSKHHRKSKQVVLSRFCCKAGYTVAGGLARLSKHASNYFQRDIISWCDLRWSDGNGYKKSGWVEDGVLKPDYFYFNKNNKKIISKQSRQKKKIGTPEDMTEHQHAKLDGLLRVYDCGKIRFIYKYEEPKISKQ